MVDAGVTVDSRLGKGIRESLSWSDWARPEATCLVCDCVVRDRIADPCDSTFDADYHSNVLGGILPRHGRLHDVHDRVPRFLSRVRSAHRQDGRGEVPYEDEDQGSRKGGRHPRGHLDLVEERLSFLPARARPGEPSQPFRIPSYDIGDSDYQGRAGK